MKYGQKVIYNNETRTIYDIYPNDMASLCLIDEDDFEYKDVEEDYLIPIKELKPKKMKTLIFNDVDNNELKVGDKVVCLDVNDLDHDDEYKLTRGDVLEVINLIDLESDYIEFKSVSNIFYSFYAHRVLKLKL